MISSNTGRRFRRSAGTAALLFLLVGCGGSADAPTGNDQKSPVEATPAATATPTTPAKSSPAPADAEATPGVPDRGMAASQPVSFSIPALDREAKIIETGLRDDQSLEVPPEHEGAPASWFNGSPTPGEVGPSVLLGHVNSLADESGVFYNLESLEKGDKISVTREDGTVANFEVYKSELYEKDEFPTKAVYFPTEEPELRLITCDGFTESSGQFEKNLVIYAEFTGRG
ncbi:sortase domain-containing protein [Arthrobacter sp. H14]|uniref:sortase domain-containing protein n=1 Tax=Arthrobacter sp. H14 TaxID=1312959 RepID=UPI00047D3BC2|nr:sortase [Arthrobacter sp. H14]